MPRKTLQFIKNIRSKGKLYVYFDTGQEKNGRPIRIRLPDYSDPDFGRIYARAVSARTRRAAVPHEITVPELIDLFQRSPKFRAYAAGTQRIYNIYLSKAAELLPTAPADRLEPGDVTLLMDKMAETPGAANSIMSAIAALYKWGRGRKRVTAKPTEGIELLETGEYDPWPEPLLERALQAPEGRVSLSTHLLYFTGQRIGDCCKILWTDIRDGRVYVVQQKTGRELDIPLHPELEAKLNATPRAGLFVIDSGRTKPIHQHTIRTELQDFALSYGCEVVPHGLRKNAVNALLEAGCSAAEVSAITGQSMQMIEHYAKKRSQPKLATAAIIKWRGARQGGKA